MYLFRQDMLTPMALDQRLPLDTLFMVFEEDYRFFADGEDPDGADDYLLRVEDLLKSRRSKASAPKESLPPPAAGEPTASGKSKGSGKVKPESRFWSTAARGSSNLKDTESEGFAENVSDLVRWATHAHRQKMGDLVWVGWCPVKKPSHMGHGAHCIMLSKAGFIKVSEGFTSGAIARGHIDISLKHWLQSPGVAQSFPCCYVFPPMGGYTQHESGCDPRAFGVGTAGRPSAFETHSPAVGTRQATDPKNRAKWLIQWRPKTGDRIWTACPSDAELVTEKYLWKSVREPTASDDKGDDDAAVSVSDEDKQRMESKRFKRTQRQHVMRDTYRHWVDDMEEAGVVGWA